MLTPKMSTQSPFDRSAVVMEKLTRKELIDQLRARINKHYMPSATGDVRCNSKPEYLRHSQPFITDAPFPNVSVSSDASGYYAFETFSNPRIGDFIVPTPKDIFLFMDLSPIYILMNLKTEDIRVAFREDGHALNYVKWEEGSEAIAIDRIVLQEVIDTYL